MKNLVTIILFTSLLFASPAMAGGNHSHSTEPVSSEEAASKASGVITKLADAQKIDATWAGTKVEGVEQKTFAQGPEWVITFKNGKVKDPTKQTLYMFFTLSGDYLGANYTGN